MNKCSKYFILNNDIKEVKEFNQKLSLDGESLYEVIKVLKGVPLFLEKHLERLHDSAKLINESIWLTNQEIKKKIDEIIKVNKINKGSLKFILNFKYRMFICFFEPISFPSNKDYINGIKTALYHRERINPNAKILNINFRKDLDKFINKQNIFEAILVDDKGNITEGSKSNIFMVWKGEIITTPTKAVLPGITRSVILEICKKVNIKIREEYVNYKKLQHMEGIFLSSTPFDLLPIVKVNDMDFISNKNQYIEIIMKHYREIIEKYIKNYDE